METLNKIFKLIFLVTFFAIVPFAIITIWTLTQKDIFWPVQCLMTSAVICPMALFLENITN